MSTSTHSLSQQLARDCDSTIMQRGSHYFHTGRVRVESGTAWRLCATVRGTSVYRVELARLGDDIRASCSCPYFDVDFCKHIWAAVLAADARRALQGNGRSGKLRLLPASTDAAVGDDDADDNEDEVDEEFEPGRRYALPAPAHPPSRQPARPPASPGWREQMAQLQPPPPNPYAPVSPPWPQGRELLYVIDIAGSRTVGAVCLEIFSRDRKKDGTWSKPKARYLPQEWLQRVESGDDRQVLTALIGATPSYGYTTDASYLPGNAHAQPAPFRYQLREAQLELLLPVLCGTGRCRLRQQPQDEEPAWLPVSWDDADFWQLRIAVHSDEASQRYELVGHLSRGAQRIPLAAALLLTDSGFMFTREHIARFEHHGAFAWIRLLREHGALSVPLTQREEFLAELWRQPTLPPLDLPEELRYEEIQCTPCPRLIVKAARDSWRRERVLGSLSFDYDATIIASDEPGRGIVQSAQRRLLLRDRTIERAADERLRQLGWQSPGYELAATRLPDVVRALVDEGWHVEAAGKLCRAASRFDIKVSSGLDWFELHGTVEFGDSVAALPQLLAAARRGERMVRLDDGSFGVMPEEWLEKYGLFVGLGTPHADHVRFTRGQVGLLDALLSAQPEVSCDALFARLRDDLQNFAGVHPADPPVGFHGALRPYQKEGLGWLYFLQQFGFGGCLADDMGLGKTVQVLALLEARRETRAGPSLVVMPKSLIFNWQQEAARFAPQLRLLDHTGLNRRKGVGHFADYDLILTTYGTLRRDAGHFKDARFDYVILDEAQAIKNATSASAKATRLLQANHRLALSGTPIENHLGEIWSLFEFLNPGMLGTSSVFKQAHAAARDPDAQTRRLLAQALRPFLLRRTKQQVLPDLPPKTEQTLYCELDAPQRKLYDELRQHYRNALLKRIARDGMARAKIQILEALLRLRQAAIHPGLIDPKRAHEPSAKLDVLLPRLLEARAEGHKTLVFSQFTSMLAILRQNLDRDAIAYEYLDGQTRDREQRVAHFQEDPDCKLFLISLKAGGLGLNLTAAQYIFLLDPWWNPAVEAQAVDRAHRIGQVNRVFAYRLIARDTIEEKVLELQNVKRNLADAIIGADSALIRDLGREDLERLLS